jgi:hypothetical protein
MYTGFRRLYGLSISKDIMYIQKALGICQSMWAPGCHEKTFPETNALAYFATIVTKQKRLSCGVEIRTQCYKTFYICNLRQFENILRVFPA